MEKGPTHSFAGFTLDLGRGVLRGPDGDVDIRPKVLSLLIYLVQNAGRVIPKDELLDAVWPNVVVTDASLTQCIGEVRRAIGDKSDVLIRTVPRRGYIFSESVLGRAARASINRDPALAVAPDDVGSTRKTEEPSGGQGASPTWPSVAVLPFANLSGDLDQEYFADGVVEDITTALGCFRRIFVIARNSAFTYKRRAVDVREVGRDLGVRYVVEGSVRKAGQRLRITAELVEAETGLQLWADRMDGIVDDVFRFQDEVTRSVIGAIAPRIGIAEEDRARRKPSGTADVYDLYLRALPLVRETTLEASDSALVLLDRVLVMDPRYAVAAALGAWAYTLRSAQGWCVDVEGEQRKGLALAGRAITDGQYDSEALSLAGYSLGFLGGQLQDGLRALSRAINLNPNSAVAFANSGWLKGFSGMGKEGAADFQKALRLSPRDPTRFRMEAGLSYALILAGDLEAAVAAARRAVESNPNFVPSQRALAATLGLSGQIEEAQKVVTKLLELVPSLTIRSFAETSPWRFSPSLDLLIMGLRRAGLP